MHSPNDQMPHNAVTLWIIFDLYWNVLLSEYGPENTTYSTSKYKIFILTIMFFLHPLYLFSKYLTLNNIITTFIYCPVLN